ncbi:MAG: hypothetical protein ACD_58C00158G0003 [uncultured bacterium]|nr:MAG: hypothetical protein ACD_58C00158G0003 [uncultured bacterium]
MILDDKKRVIGKIISINSDRFTVELLSGIKNFNASGYDDIHYFAQINSYVIVPYQNHYIVSEVIGVREKDTPDFTNAKEQELSKVFSIKHLDVLPIGTIKDKVFTFGVSVYPTLYSDVLYIKDEELDALFEVLNAEVPKCNDCEKDEEKCEQHNDGLKGKTRTKSLDVGESAIFPDYKIKINIDKFFGSHSAVLGNTGSGKSCTIASMLQTIFSKDKEFFAIGSTFVIFDVNGEYKQAFDNLDKSKINVSNFSIEKKKDFEKLELPHYFLNVEEWTLLLNASEKTQIPILRNALGLATLFSKSGAEIVNIKNHILASCIIETFNSSDSPVSKYQKIQSLLTRGAFTSNIDNGYSAQYGNFTTPTQEKAFLDAINGFLLKTHFEIPSFDNTSFSFDELGGYLDLAILYEEAHGNKQIRDYCSSLITRFKSIQERTEFSFLTDKNSTTLDSFVNSMLGLKDKKKEKQVIILDLNSAEDEVVEVISTVITRLIFARLKKVENEKRNKFPVNLVLEEAHRYISNDTQRNSLKANYIFERVAKEGRKYGLFLLVSSQRPSELSRTVLSQCNNFIVHRIQNPDDLSHIRQITPHISEATLKKLPSIPTQHALIFGSAVNIPTLYKVKNAHPLPLSDNNQVSENWFVDKDHEFDI